VTAGAFLLCSCRAREAPPLERQRYGPDHQGKPEQSYEKSHDVAPAPGVVIVRLG
jgi:hypothetical protein